ncbi:helix-turn-helix domain-containing protein [Sphingobacterium daejeonense]|uniref:helix-turn-helix domain-containing protein n=1 Tax=Sphingobacterium daejeonense TaxID=371142 RepID=UPI003D3142D7
MNTGKIISDLREQMGWAQKYLDEKSGISRIMIDKYERGRCRVLHRGCREDRRCARGIPRLSRGCILADRFRQTYAGQFTGTRTVRREQKKRRSKT